VIEIFRIRDNAPPDFWIESDYNPPPARVTKQLLVAAILAVTPNNVPEIYRAEAGSLQTPSKDLAVLGKKLFSDPLLSADGKVSCATCHVPGRAFTDGSAVGTGVAGKKGDRSTPTVINRALGKTQFWDGRAATLEEQALGPIANPIEMNLPIGDAVAKLKANKEYVKAFQKVFKAPPDEKSMAAALAAYQRTVWSVQSPFDRFIGGDKTAMSEAAQRGLLLFGNKAKCSVCHVGINFTDEDFHVLGVGQDVGREKVSKVLTHRGAFKTPTLREIARTAPYMHDGSMGTLSEVIDYYDRGGNHVPALDPKMTPLQLSAEEKKDLLAFLEALSGEVIDVDGVVKQEQGEKR
jgi:cytochrome c peroxidase